MNSKTLQQQYKYLFSVANQCMNSLFSIKMFQKTEFSFERKRQKIAAEAGTKNIQKYTSHSQIQHRAGISEPVMGLELIPGMKKEPSRETSLPYPTKGLFFKAGNDFL